MKRALLTLSLAIVVVWSFLQFGGAQVVPQPGPPQAIACAYNTSPPTLTSGQAGWVQCDSAGKIITSGGGGGGGAVTIADGADVTEGAIADPAATAGSTGTVSAKLRLVTTQLSTVATAANQSTMITSLASIATNTAAAIPAGSAIIGKVGIDQTTPGTTNGVQVNAALPAGTNDIGNVGGRTNVTPTDCSGTITTGGTAQNAHTAQSTLRGMTIANLDATEVMWISFTTTAAASTTQSYPLAPATATTFAGLASYTTPLGFGYNTALSVIAATTGHKFSCTRW